MIKVSNKKVIAVLSRRSLAANRNRNVIAVLAIVITAVLFTSLFTIAGTIVNSFEQATFRQVGGDMHGTFKNVTGEQLRELSSDPLIVKRAARMMLGMPVEKPLNKVHAEVSYMDEDCAKGYFCTPTHGSLPQEGTDQIACDTRILTLLGAELSVGEKITLSYTLGQNTENPKQVADTFTLSGWWEYDPASVASHAIVPLSYADKILDGYVRASSYDVTGRWDLNVYLKSSAHIEYDLRQILTNHGYQTDDSNADNYISVGVNWAYLGAQVSNNADFGTLAAMAILLAVIIFTGYLIIYNIFQISVANDIRFYGLLKTIGTTGRQIRRIIRRQALALSAVGIPIGLIIGYLLGNVLSPVIMSTLSYKIAFVSANPLIFVGAAAFSLVTVLLSCRKPAKIAGRVSPVEAVRYTENTGVKKNIKKSSGGGKVSRMALANFARSKKKTLLVVLSLSLAVVLLQITYTFSIGFDMDKYLRQFVVSDFIVGNADYFQAGRIYDADSSVPEDVIADINAVSGITESGRIYGNPFLSQMFITEEYYREKYRDRIDEQRMDLTLNHAARSSDGLIPSSIQLYGMEDLPLDKLTVIAGDLAPLYDPSRNAIAAVYLNDDYGSPEIYTEWVKPGDEVTVRYADSWDDYEYYDIRTGETVDAPNLIDDPLFLSQRAKNYHDATYTVAACVSIPYSMSFRFYSSDQFLLNSEVFRRDTGKDDIMAYLLDTTEESRNQTEEFLAYYTENIEPAMDYESKQSYTNEFESFRSMFILLGGTLSAVIGLVGILNFFNAILTSILTRKREFAMLQSIGMTGRQLNGMLVCEGVFYAGFTLTFSLILSLATGPLLNVSLSGLLWFFTYRFTIIPVSMVTPIFLFLGILIPLVTYRFSGRQTVVERLREAE